MAKTYCECSACGYLIPVESTECSNCGGGRPSQPEALTQQVVLRVPEFSDPLPAASRPAPGPALPPGQPAPVTVNPASLGAVDELLLEELRSLRRMQDRQGRSILRWMKMQSLILALTGLFVTIIILLAYIAITGPIG